MLGSKAEGRTTYFMCACRNAPHILAQNGEKEQEFCNKVAMKSSTVHCHHCPGCKDI